MTTWGMPGKKFDEELALLLLDEEDLEDPLGTIEYVPAVQESIQRDVFDYADYGLDIGDDDTVIYRCLSILVYY